MRSTGLDDFEQESGDPANPLLKRENVVALPHVGSGSDATPHTMTMKATEWGDRVGAG